jgi:hypothetical protein
LGCPFFNNVPGECLVDGVRVDGSSEYKAANNRHMHR